MNAAPPVGTLSQMMRIALDPHYRESTWQNWSTVSGVRKRPSLFRLSRGHSRPDAVGRIAENLQHTPDAADRFARLVGMAVLDAVSSDPRLAEVLSAILREASS